jgi:hypothetical protein
LFPYRLSQQVYEKKQAESNASAAPEAESDKKEEKKD